MSETIESVLRESRMVTIVMTDGSEAQIPSSVNLVCAIAILRAVDTLSELADLDMRLSYQEWERVNEMIGLSRKGAKNPGIQIDVLRIMRDSKYAVFVQDMLPSMSREDVSRFVQHTVRGHVFSLSLDSFGCRVIQKLIEIGTTEDVLGLVHPELASKVVDCSLDVNGNHVIQKIIDVLPSGDCQFVVDAILADRPTSLRRLCSHCFGCRVVQRVMSKCNPAQTDDLFEALCSDPNLIVSLAGDAFGNYVVQHAIEYGRPIDMDRVVVCLASLDIVMLGCCKFASNVVEKLIRSQNKPSLTTPSSVVVMKLLISSLMTCVSDDHEPAIMSLMKDRYGNYIVRAIVELTNPEFAAEVGLVTSMIVSNAASLKKFTFSWHLVERLGKRNHGL
jgi:hypothetical protein